MDSKTKALLKQAKLHDEGAVTITYEPHYGTIKVMAHPQKVSFSISDNLLAMDVSDYSYFADKLSTQIGNMVQKKVMLELQKTFSPPSNPWKGAFAYEGWNEISVVEKDLSNQMFMTDEPTSFGPLLSLVKPAISTGEEIISVLNDSIPGFEGMHVVCPVDDCCGNDLLFDVIITLNDKHQWTREAIADWLDTLDLDLTIKVPEEVKQ